MTDRPRILVVDDEPKIRDLIRRLLTREGYTVETAKSGDTALEELGRFRPDLLLSDIRMPGMDGLELLRRARSVDADLAFILITGYSSTETAVFAMREGVNDYISKPFSATEPRPDHGEPPPRR
jgi:DNA-binding NtrC family response regulator